MHQPSPRRRPAVRNDDFEAAKQARVYRKRARSKQGKSQGYQGQIKSRERGSMFARLAAEIQRNALGEVAERKDGTDDGRHESDQEHKARDDCDESQRRESRNRPARSREHANALSNRVHGGSHPQDDKAGARPPIRKGGEELLQPVPPRVSRAHLRRD